MSSSGGCVIFCGDLRLVASRVSLLEFLMSGGKAIGGVGPILLFYSGDTAGEKVHAT